MVADNELHFHISQVNECDFNALPLTLPVYKKNRNDKQKS